MVKATLAIYLWGSAAVGHLWSPLNMIERVVAGGAALLLVVALPVTDEAGFAVAVAFFIWHRLRTRKLHA